MKAQYAILRFAKYKGPEIGRIESHNERTKEKYASNPDVDTSRSHLNFHLVMPQHKYRAEAEKQIAEAGCRTRSDSVRVVEALVTASPEFFKGKKKSEVKAYFIQHVGSTAICSIHAKPIIDIAVAVHDIKDILPYIEVLKQHNIFFHEGAVAGEVFFVMEDGDIRTHHIHIVKRNGTGWSNYISFRDYLNANPEKAMMYDEFKRKSAVRFADDRKRYTASKQEIIGQLLSEASM